MADPAVRRLTLAERGLWIDLLALASEGKPYGYVTDWQGKALSAKEIAMRVNAESPEQVETLIAGILVKGAASQEGGRLYNRRMKNKGEFATASATVLLQQKRRFAGRLGGRQKQLNYLKMKELLLQQSAIASAIAPSLPFHTNKDLTSFGTTSEQNQPVDNSAAALKPSPELLATLPGGSLATAPLDGALRSPPTDVPEAKRPHELSAAEVLAIVRSKRQTGAAE
jgi:hypothetical protein